MYIACSHIWRKTIDRKRVNICSFGRVQCDKIIFEGTFGFFHTQNFMNNSVHIYDDIWWKILAKRKMHKDANAPSKKYSTPLHSDAFFLSLRDINRHCSWLDFWKIQVNLALNFLSCYFWGDWGKYSKNGLTFGCLAIFMCEIFS